MGAAESSTSWRAYVLAVLAGPAAFVMVRAVPFAGLAPEAHLALGVYAWTVAWWVTTPVPWAVTSFLPFVILPLGGAMPLSDVSASYGRSILPYLMGVMLFGHAFQKHGLARRIALAALSVPGLARSGVGLDLRDPRRFRRDVRSAQRSGGHRDDDADRAVAHPFRGARRDAHVGSGESGRSVRRRGRRPGHSGRHRIQCADSRTAGTAHGIQRQLRTVGVDRRHPGGGPLPCLLSGS